jgi:hypothetical protein
MIEALAKVENLLLCSGESLKPGYDNPLLKNHNSSGL